MNRVREFVLSRCWCGSGVSCGDFIVWGKVAFGAGFGYVKRPNECSGRFSTLISEWLVVRFSLELSLARREWKVVDMFQSNFLFFCIECTLIVTWQELGCFHYCRRCEWFAR